MHFHNIVSAETGRSIFSHITVVGALFDNITKGYEESAALSNKVPVVHFQVVQVTTLYVLYKTIFFLL